MKNTIYRQKSIERISSPDQLNDYIKVSSPSVWVVLIAIVVLLSGACVWGVFGQLDTIRDVVAVAQGGRLTCYVREDEQGVQAGLTVRVEGESAKVLSVGAAPVAASTIGDAYTLHLGALAEGDWVVALPLGETALPDGSYTAQLIVDSVSPMSFVLN